MQKTALVVGATGVIGRGLVDHLIDLGDWRVIGAQRHPPGGPRPESLRYVAVDLLDPVDTAAKAPALADVTHVFYAAFVDAPTQAEQVAPNLALLRNLIERATPAMNALQRLVLVEGNKWYGSHLGPFRTPAKEDDPRCPPPMFYHDQQDFLEAGAAGRPWSWTALRPQTVCGFSLGSAMNLMTAIGVYASLRKHQGLPLDFPGKPGAFRAIYQVTDARHLAKAQVWAATSPDAADRPFNVTNGDFFRWQNVWPRLAEHFGMAPGGIETQRLADTMPPLASLWDELVRTHDLQPHAMDALVKWPFADYVWSSDWDVMTATTRIRQAGFQDVVDSEDMLLDILTAFRRERIVP
ncbi:MAG: SDR family oxidoreductase [Pseudomonadota bacterium]